MLLTLNVPLDDVNILLDAEYILRGIEVLTLVLSLETCPVAADESDTLWMLDDSVDPDVEPSTVASALEIIASPGVPPDAMDAWPAEFEWSPGDPTSDEPSVDSRGLGIPLTLPPNGPIKPPPALYVCVKKEWRVICLSKVHHSKKNDTQVMKQGVCVCVSREQKEKRGKNKEKSN